MKQQTITVRGKANVKAKPDYVDILVDLEIRNMKYDVGMAETARKIDVLKTVLKTAGLDPEDLRTMKFGVDTAWKLVEDRYGNKTKRVFDGYEINQRLRFGFDFHRERLNSVLVALTKSGINSKFEIRFSVKDPSKVKEALFEKASENARKIAECLCRGVGKRLGEILNVNYSWDEMELYYKPADIGCGGDEDACEAPDITPDDIDASDSVTFTWELA